MSSEEKHLLNLFCGLSDADRSAVIAFAEFLTDRKHEQISSPFVPLSINQIPRPTQESVPAALKRLRNSYSMLDASDLLAEASDLLSQHLMLGRGASDVIDDMEALFERHYQHYCEGPEGE